MIVHHLLKNDSRFGVIVLTDRMDNAYLKNCIDHITGSVGVEFNFIVVESRGDEFYYGKSMNAGMKALPGCDLVVSMDNDANVQSDALKKIFDYMLLHSDVGFCGGWSCDLDGSIINVGGVMIRHPIGYLFDTFVNSSIIFGLKRISKGGNYYYKEKYVKEYLPGRMSSVDTEFCCIRRRCWEDIASFDEDYRGPYISLDISFKVLLDPFWFVSSCPAKYYHVGKLVTRSLYPETGGSKEFSGLDVFLRKWPKDKIKEVCKKVKQNKFLCYDGIPDR